MPELPDVENYRRYLGRTALDRRIGEVAVGDDRILEGVSRDRLVKTLRGHRLAETRRHGKHLFARLDGGGWLGLHFGMTGRLSFFEVAQDDPKHDRLRLDFSEGGHLAFENQRLLGRVRLIEDLDRFLRAEDLGPDALDSELDRTAFKERLRGRRTSVKSVLMNQDAVAGIGNVYSDEILFQARLHPAMRVQDMDEKQRNALHRSMRRVLEMAIDKGAGTEDVEKRVPRSWLLPHRHKGARCPRCGGTIEQLKTSGRTAWLCPRCQPEP